MGNIMSIDLVIKVTKLDREEVTKPKEKSTSQMCAGVSSFFLDD